ncbi:MAG: hypothetical protein KZQ58_05510, partial [gamma proteobacterium symbiont of Bathyaustriella thionipta]|nr:hypothetical protein [gamma proteobacterium symbiont of Bathyaustriella thionipta]
SLLSFAHWFISPITEYSLNYCLDYGVHFTPSISTAAARISLQFKLPMADSIIYTTAHHFGATVWTQDVDFKGLPNVNYIAKQ